MKLFARFRVLSDLRAQALIGLQELLLVIGHRGLRAPSGAEGGRDDFRDRLVEWAFVVFVSAIPFESIRWGIFSGAFSPSRLAGIILVGAALLLRPRACFRAMPAALVLFGVYYLVAVLRTVPATPRDPEALSMGLTRYVTLAQMLVLVWISYNLLQRDRTSTAMLWALAVGCAIAAALILYGLGATDYKGTGRASFLEENPNSAGGVLAVGALAFVELASRNWRQRKWVSALAAPSVMAVLAVLAKTGSRTAAVGFAAGALTWAFTSLYRGKRERAWAIIGLFVFALFAWASISERTTRTRWEIAAGGGDQGGVGYRKYIFAEAWGLLLDRPLLGWGTFENANEIGRRLGTYPRDTHNIYLWVLTEVGVVGGAPFLVATYLAFAAAWRARSQPAGRIALVFLIAVAVVGLGTNWISRKPFWLITAYALAQGARMRRVREEAARAPLVEHDPQASRTVPRPTDAYPEEGPPGESSFPDDPVPT